MSRFIALHCSDDSAALIEKHPTAFLLLTQIAMRAKWKDCPINGLKAGQAWIGDWREAGIRTENAYRHAKKVLETCQLATFRGTSKGTIATLSTSTIYSISKEANHEQEHGPATSQPQASNGRTTTNHTDTRTHGYTDHKHTHNPRAKYRQEQ
ncbi:MAG TPA: hypothetical protein VIM57_01165 [Luteolibacter sp.]